MERQYYLMVRDLYEDSKIEFVSRFNTEAEAISWYKGYRNTPRGYQYFIQEVLEL